MVNNKYPEIAIIDPNTLSCMGLEALLEEIIPMATIRVFHSFGELVDDTPDMYAHYFVSSQIYFEHTAFFRERRPRAIVLVGGENLPQLSGRRRQLYRPTPGPCCTRNAWAGRSPRRA